MPRMDGIDFLEKLMRLRPMPVVMVSSLTGKGSEITLRALELGAVDFVTKPQLGIREGMLAYSEMIAEKIRTASRAKLAAHKPTAAPATLKAGPLLSSEKLLVIGASTGEQRQFAMYSSHCRFQAQVFLLRSICRQDSPVRSRNV